MATARMQVARRGLEVKIQKQASPLRIDNACATASAQSARLAVQRPLSGPLSFRQNVLKRADLRRNPALKRTGPLKAQKDFDRQGEHEDDRKKDQHHHKAAASTSKAYSKEESKPHGLQYEEESRSEEAGDRREKNAQSGTFRSEETENKKAENRAASMRVERMRDEQKRESELSVSEAVEREGSDSKRAGSDASMKNTQGLNEKSGEERSDQNGDEKLGNDASMQEDSKKEEERGDENETAPIYTAPVLLLPHAYMRITESFWIAEHSAIVRADDRKALNDEQKGREDEEHKIEEIVKGIHEAGMEKDRQEERVEKKVKAKKADARDKKEAEASSPYTHPVDEWTTQDVVQWAADQGFVATKLDVHRLIRAKISGPDLPYWTAEDFEEIGLAKGTSKRLVRAINELCVRRTIRIQMTSRLEEGPHSKLPTAHVTLEGDDELTDFLGEMMALGLVHVPDTSAEKAVTSAEGADFQLTRSIWELENGGLYRPYYMRAGSQEAEENVGNIKE